MEKRKLYLDYLSKPVLNRSGVLKPIVRHPKKWDIENYSISGEYLNIEEELLKGRKVWVWSDHHFYHTNIISLSNRNYLDIEHMHREFIKNYNETVSEGDICIWLGDITFKSTLLFNSEIYPNFKKTYNILVFGNHDFENKKIRNLNFDERHLSIELNFMGENIFFTHLPCHFENQEFINVHGHIHSYKSLHNHQINVSVEAIEFKPVLLIDLIRDFKLK